jgi:hypothetical protein
MWTHSAAVTQAAPSAAHPNPCADARTESVTRSWPIRRASPVRPENRGAWHAPRLKGRHHSRVDDPSANRAASISTQTHTAVNNVINNGPELIETVATEAEHFYAHADDRAVLGAQMAMSKLAQAS